MYNTVQQFLRKYANCFYVKFCGINEEMNLLKVSVSKRSFQTTVRASAVGVIKHHIGPIYSKRNTALTLALARLSCIHCRSPLLVEGDNDRI